MTRLRHPFLESEVMFDGKPSPEPTASCQFRRRAPYVLAPLLLVQSTHGLPYASRLSIGLGGDQWKADFKLRHYQFVQRGWSVSA